MFVPDKKTGSIDLCLYYVFGYLPFRIQVTSKGLIVEEAKLRDDRHLLSQLS